VFFSFLLGIIDFGQVIFAHQSLVERVRSAVRWSVVHPWQGNDPVINLVLYDQTNEPRVNTPGFLGLKAENVLVHYRSPTPERPDDETVSVTIVNFQSQFFSPWIARTLVSPRPVSITAPMAYRPAAELN
jgi:hypothetical protein